eukprot:m51a1_g6246 hypothetical protein (1711) ;mRNA; r:28044-43995
MDGPNYETYQVKFIFWAQQRPQQPQDADVQRPPRRSLSSSSGRDAAFVAPLCPRSPSAHQAWAQAALGGSRTPLASVSVDRDRVEAAQWQTAGQQQRGLDVRGVWALGSLEGSHTSAAAATGDRAEGAQLRSCLKHEVSALSGFVVLMGASANVCYVIADGVEFTPGTESKLWGFRDVPAGCHTVAVGITWSGPLLSLRFVSKPGGVAVLKVADGALVEEKQRDFYDAIARGVIVGTLGADLVPFPAAATDARKAERHVRILGCSSGLCTPEQRPRSLSVGCDCGCRGAVCDALEAPLACTAASAKQQMTLWDIVKLEGLFDEVNDDPTSSTLRQCYLEMVHYNLLLGTDDVALTKDGLEQAWAQATLGGSRTSVATASGTRDQSAAAARTQGLRPCLKRDVSVLPPLPGFVVLLGPTVGVSSVFADGVEFAPGPAAEFWGFRDVPPGYHTIAVATAQGEQTLSLGVRVEPGGVAVLKVADGALVEETQRAIVNAIARGVIVGSLKIDLARFPQAPTGAETRKADYHVRIAGHGSPDQSRKCGRPASRAQEAGLWCPGAAAAKQQMTLSDVVKLEGLFDEVNDDPTSSTLRQCYLEMVHYNLLLGTDDVALTKELGRSVQRHLETQPALRSVLARDSTFALFKEQAVGSSNKGLAAIGRQLAALLRESPSTRASMTLRLLHEAAQLRGARCLDGTSPGYYYRAGQGAGASKWVIYINGGGWCYTVRDCAERTKLDIGSSKDWPPTASAPDSGQIHYDSKTNPDFWDWNHVMVQYCDGASFTGDREQPVVDPATGKTLYMRGLRIINAVFSDLLDRGMLSATEVQLTGCSAGGLSTMLHADRLAALLSEGVKFGSVPLSGYFMHQPSAEGVPVYPDEMRSVFAVHNSSAGVPPSCLAARAPDRGYECLFASELLGHVSAPVFVVNSKYDSWSARCIFAAQPEGDGEPPGPDGNCLAVPGWSQCLRSETCTRDEVQSYAAWSAALRRRGNGAFVISCYAHGAELHGGWDKIAVNGTVMSAAVGHWWASSFAEPAAAHTYVDCDYGEQLLCNMTCQYAVPAYVKVCLSVALALLVAVSLCTVARMRRADRSMRATAFAAVCCLLALAASTRASVMALRLLHEAAQLRGARCLDGTSPGYYYRAGQGSGASKWVISINSGGWCFTVGDCAERTKLDIGSSKDWPPTYCDGASFTGDREQPVVDPATGKTLYMRGLRIINAVFSDLLDRGMRSATEFGSVPLSGYFMHQPSAEGVPVYPDEMRSVFAVHNSSAGVPPSCLAARAPDRGYECLFASELLGHVSAPVFVVNSKYDSWSARCIFAARFEGDGPNGRCLAVPGWSACLRIETCTRDQVQSYAACPGYYYRAGQGAGASKWVISINSGGWCFTVSDCAERTKLDIGSSKDWPHTASGFDDRKRNPDFWDWNHVMVQYCDGASFTGDREQPVVDPATGKTLYMRGLRIINAVFSDLLDRGMRSATEFGSVPLSGYFMHQPSVEGVPVYPDEMRSVFAVHNSSAGVPPSCLTARAPDCGYECLFASELLGHVSAPVFVVNSKYDSWSARCIFAARFEGDCPNGRCLAVPGWSACLRIETCTRDQVQSYTAWSAALRRRGNGAFVTSCYEHGAELIGGWDRIAVNGTTMSAAVGRWWASSFAEPAAAHTHVDDCVYTEQLLCNRTCLLAVPTYVKMCLGAAMALLVAVSLCTVARMSAPPHVP